MSPMFEPGPDTDSASDCDSASLAGGPGIEGGGGSYFQPTTTQSALKEAAHWTMDGPPTRCLALLLSPSLLSVQLFVSHMPNE